MKGNKLKILLLVPGLMILLSACPAENPVLARPEPKVEIPRNDNIVVDGKPADWESSYFISSVFSDVRGEVPEPGDFRAQFRMAWDSLGILFLFEIQDDKLFEDPQKYWNGDGVEIFVSPRKGSEEIIQISVRPSLELSSFNAASKIYDHRKDEALLKHAVSSSFFRSLTDTSYIIEGRFNFESFGPLPEELPCELAIQMYFNDSDMKDDSCNFSLPWYPVRESYRNPFAFFPVRLIKGQNLDDRNEVLFGAPEVRSMITADKRLIIKVLSGFSTTDQTVNLEYGDRRKLLNLQAEFPDICSHVLEIPPGKQQEGSQLEFFLEERLFFSINQVMLFREYDEELDINRFEPEIRIFEIRDHFNRPSEQAVLFVGSSTFRKWKKIDEDLPGFEILNRGFGGSTMEDLNHYFERIVLPYRPSAIIVYEGDNDIARGASPIKFIRECEKFLESCSSTLPGTRVCFVSIKPSPSRVRHWEKMKRANEMLAELSRQREGVFYVDISPALLDSLGNPDPGLFVSDRLHLNRKGYRAISEILYKNLNQIVHP